MKINEYGRSTPTQSFPRRRKSARFSLNASRCTQRAQYGRSMVEMLGVLAIVGVLSLIGILGYNIAIRRYQANEIANTVATLMVMAHAANAGEGGCIQLSKSNLSEYPGGVHVDIVADPDVGGILAIELKGSDDDALCGAVEDIVGNLMGEAVDCNPGMLTHTCSD